MGMSGWIGVDLDGTIAEYSSWKGPQHVGAPIMPVVSRVKQLLEAGYTVKIFTARVHGHKPEELPDVCLPIWQWCEQHIGQKLDITCVKDFAMIELWDDRAVAVEHNTGRFLSPSQLIR